MAKGWWKAGEEEWSDRREDIAAGRREAPTWRQGGGNETGCGARLIRFGRAGGDVGSGLGDGDLSAGEPTQTFTVTAPPRWSYLPRGIDRALCAGTPVSSLLLQCREQPAHALAFHRRGYCCCAAYHRVINSTVPPRVDTSHVPCFVFLYFFIITDMY